VEPKPAQSGSKTTKSITLLLALGLAGLALGQTPEPRFSLTISVPQTVVKVGANVGVDIAKKNISNQNIEYVRRLGFLGVGYDIVVTDSSGRQMPEGEFLHAKRSSLPPHWQGEGSEIIGALKPGQVLHQSFDANLVRDMTKPGAYTIQISQTVYASQADFKAGKKIVVRSNTVTVTVTD
jgi:hypothetical protein